MDISTHMPVHSDAAALAAKHQLYGRTDSVRKLLEALERVNRGDGEVVLLPGLSGSGKTALARILRDPSREQNGYFLEGKFNQFDQTLPYVAWRQALADFHNAVMRENQVQRARWAKEIREAVGHNGQLLVDLVPEFELLIGEQAPVDTISPLESRYRFSGVIRSLLQVICRPEHPLVLFLDDWQWADAASLHLLTQLQIGTTLRYVLILGTYRSDEVGTDHPLQTALTDVRNLGVTVSPIDVPNLQIEQLEELISESASEDMDVASLARRIHSQTEGNPFFTHAVLGLFCDGGRSATPENVELPNDVVQLFADRIESIDAECAELLSLSACLGHRFEIETLATITENSVERCREILDEQATGLLIPGTATGTETRNWYQFLHDRVQQAAYARISESDLPIVRLNIARQLLNSLSAEQLENRLCDVVGHLNAGINLIESVEERIRCIELNISAARQVRSATAYGAALEYHRAARRAMNEPEVAEPLWKDHHELAMALFLEQAETEFLEGNRNEARRCIREAVARASTAVERAEALIALVVQYTLQANYPEAIASGREALAALGMSLAEDDFEQARDTEIEEVLRQLNGRSIKQLLDLPAASDETMRTAARVLITMGPPCYRAHQRLWSVIVPRVVNLTIQYGHVPQIGYSHTAFAGLLGWVSNDYSSGREFTEFAEELMSGTPASPSDQSVFHLMIGSSARHWFEHLMQSSDDYLAAYRIGSQSGNLQYAAYAFGHNMYCRYYQGTPLQVMIHETQSSLAFAKTRRNQWAVDLLEGGLHLLQALSAESLDEQSDEWEDWYLRNVETHQNQQVVCIYKVLKAHQCLVLGQSERALEISREVEPLLYTVGTQGLLPWPESVFTRLLSLTALAESDVDDEMQRLFAQLEIWAKHSPDNFEHKRLLASAEFARLESRIPDATQLYDDAIDSAAVGGFIQWQGVAAERASMFWMSQGNGQLEQLYWQRAWLCFDQWGATAKLNLMAGDLRNGLLADLNSRYPERSGRDVFIRLAQKQVDLLHDQARDLALARRHADTASRAEELAAATDLLRANVAEGRKTSAELQEQRDAERALNDELEIRVRERTAALQESNEALEESNVELQQFAYIASHDLQTPLRAVSGYAQLLEIEHSDKLDDEARTYIESIVTGTKRMKQLIDDMLRYSRVDSRAVPFEPVDLNEVMRDVRQLLEASITDTNADLDSETLPIVFGDQSQLTQLMQNLIGNAIKYHGDDRPVVRVSAHVEPGQITFSVNDNGIGIAPSHHDRIFEIFRRLHTNEEYPGTGIGLAVCRRIVNRHRGRIWVESEAGAGSTFRFTLPDHQFPRTD